MNIGRRYQVAVEANGVQQRATAASHAGGLVSARMSRFRAERAGSRICAGERAVAFDVCVECRVVSGWLVDGDGDGRG
jgi:hypothetical protein